MIRGIDHVQVLAPAGSEDDARSFFGGLLGLVEVPKPDELAARGGVWFAVGAAQQLHVSVEDGFTPATRAHPAFVVDDLDGLRDRLEQAAVPVRDDVPWEGVRRFHASDPFGNRLEFLEAAA